MTKVIKAYRYDYSDDENLYERDFDHYGEDDEQ